jgi:hypothetical protein
VPPPDQPRAMDGIVLVSHHADQNSFANAS